MNDYSNDPFAAPLPCIVDLRDRMAENERLHKESKRMLDSTAATLRALDPFASK